MLSSALVLLALAAAAAAETGSVLLECPGGPSWSLYRDQFEASCLRLMPKPEYFDDAFRACFAAQSRMLSLLHKRSKVLFVNDLIVQAAGENRTMWFFDPLDAHHDLVKKESPAAAAAAGPSPRWLVINPSSDESRIELLVNMTAVPRSFICEAPARPAAQRAQFEREPEDAFISEELLLPLAPPSDSKTAPPRQPPFIVSFNCQAYGIPKPTVEWVLTGESDDNQTLTVEPINATVIHDPKLPLAEDLVNTAAAAVFFNLQRDCSRSQACPADSIQERSQLIAVNPQFLLLAGGGRRIRRVACVARNDFGATLSREAQLFVARLGQFANRTESVTLQAGLPAVVPNVIAAEPDAATVECFRVLRPAAAAAAASAGPAKLVPMSEVNAATGGAFQMSRATFDLIVDAAGPGDAGEYMCQARLGNGRLGHVLRERTIHLTVEPCSAGTDAAAAAACDLSAKPVSVVPGYPRSLSMNPLSNRVIRPGDDFLLECPCTGKRHPGEELSVNWRLDNHTDLAATLLPALPRGSALLMRGADGRVHSGTYQCQCARASGYSQLSDWSSVRVDILPSAAPETVGRGDGGNSTAPASAESVVRVKAGQLASIQCRHPDAAATRSSASLLAVSVQPLRGIKPLAQAHGRFQVSRSDTGQFTLTIANVTAADADVYGCRVAASYQGGRWVDYNTYYTTLLVD